MKGYRSFILVFSTLLVLYIITELNKPTPIDWTVTLSQSHKTPYGGYIIANQLRDIFPSGSVRSYRTPVYSQLNNYVGRNTAYILFGTALRLSSVDMKELKNYVSQGNYAFLAYQSYPKGFLDSFKLQTNTRFTFSNNDSTHINFVNAALKSSEPYTFLRSTIDEYFSQVDTAKTIILGVNDRGDANFIKVSYGDGAFFLHINPLCFSNYFLMHQNNAEYASKALSYIPEDVSAVYWDEYYKLGRGGPATPLRFLLSNEHLRWALRIALAGMLIYVLFQLKRRQRIIPVIEPLRNTTLDFIRTVASVYFNAKDNKAIAEKKINYWLEFIRHRFNISTQLLDGEFTDQLSRKSGVDKSEIVELTALVSEMPSRHINDHVLLALSKKIDNFYKQV